MSDFRKNCKTTDKYIELIIHDKPNETFVCKKKIHPCTCNIVLGMGGLHVCLNCKNLVNLKTIKI
jgi:hypothetical protein